MKKGLFSILAGALLVVGCQNYDDQFSNIESQITALASQVAGLSQVQSDLTALAGTVNSLQTSVANTVDAALADGLADIDAAVASLEAATASAASSEDVQAIADSVADTQTSLDELLAQSSVYQGSIIVNSVSLLNVYHAIGDGLAIVNGSVTITNSAEMHAELDENGDNKVQALINNILVTLEDFTYTAGTGVTDEMTFNNLTGTRSLTLDQKGGYVAQNLSSATQITLDDDATVDVVDLRGLTSVTWLKDDTSAAAGTFTFSKALELHLTALPRSPSATLSLGVDEGGVIDITALTDVDAAGSAVKLNLTLDGPDTINISALTGDKAGSTVSLTNVVNATVTGYDGTVTIGEDVQNFTSSGLVDWSVSGNDLVTVNVTGILDPNAATADTKGPIVNLASQGDLTTVTTAGTFETVTIASNGNLVTATIGGTVTAAGGISVTGNSDLTTLDVSGATTDKINLDGNSDLETMNINFTAAKGAATTQEGTIIVNNNESLTSLTIGTDNIDNLTITNNADLALINLTGMTAIGATATAAVTITDNDLNATTSTDDEDGATAAANVADGAAGDLGSFVTTSGMDTAKAYLTAVAANAASAATVKFDKVDSVVDSEGATDTETSDQLDVAILTLTAKVVSTPAEGDKKHTIAFAIESDAAVQFGINTGAGNSLGAGDLLGGASATRFISLSANPTLAIAQIKEAANLTRATAYGLSLDAFVGHNPEGKITITPFASSTTADYSIGTAKAHGGVYKAYSTDVYKLTINGKSVTTSVAFNSATNSVNGGATTTLAIIDGPLMNALSARWNAVYGNVGAASYSESLFVTSENSEVLSIATKEVNGANTSGRRGFNKSYSISRIAGNTTGAQASTNLSFHYGATTDSSDNNTTSDDIIVVVSAAQAGTILDEARHISVTGLGIGNTVTRVTTTLNLNVDLRTSTVNDIFPLEARGDGANGTGGDANLPEGGIAEIATAATTFNRVGWL